MDTQFRPIESLERRRLMAAGELDPTFGANGVAALPYVGFDTAAEVLPDGKILVAATEHFNEIVQFALRRFLANGTPDATFGGVANGQPAGTPVGTVRHVAGGATVGIPAHVDDLDVLPDGKILVAGAVGGFDVEYAVARFNADGSLDTTFGGFPGGGSSLPMLPGTAEVDFPDHDDQRLALESMAVAPDGRIALAGAYSQGDLGVVALLNPDGSVDRLHNWAQSFQSQPNFSEYGGGAVAFLPDGTLIVGGTATTLVSSGTDFLRTTWVLRAFDRTGRMVWDAPPPQDLPEAVTGLVVEPGGTVLAAGSRGSSMVVARVGPDGAFDPAFGNGGGLASASVGPNNVAGPAGIERLPDGRFYVLGRQLNPGEDYTFYLTRFLPSGVADPTFGGLHRVAALDQGIIHSEHGLLVSRNDALVVAVENVRDESTFFSTFQPFLYQYEGDAPAGAAMTLTRNGTLRVTGSGGGDLVSITRRARDGRILAVVNGEARLFLPHMVKRIQIFTADGDDAVTVGPGVRGAYVEAGAGNDYAAGGTGNDWFLGDGGDDTLTGGDGDDSLVGGDGNDSLVGAVGNDSLEGGVGNDTLDGNAGNDYLLGSAGHDVISGHGGRDHLIGAGGNDRLFGGPGSVDNVSGGLGSDQAANDPLDNYAGVETLLP